MLVRRVYFLLSVNLFVCSQLFGQEIVTEGSADQTPIQSREAIDLDDQLAQEMDNYRARLLEFRRSLREKHSRGEDRIAAMEQWQKDHREWNRSWEERSKHLDAIWNWGPEGRPRVPEKKEDPTTASGRVAAALKKIRRENKETGRSSDRIARWTKDNKALLQQAEAEQVVPAAPEDRRQPPSTLEETELYDARKKLSQIRKRLLAQGKEAWKSALKNPDSEYSRQKRIVESQIQAVLNASPEAPQDQR